jgi:hypothetical protein
VTDNKSTLGAFAQTTKRLLLFAVNVFIKMNIIRFALKITLVLGNDQFNGNECGGDGGWGHVEKIK